VDTRRETFLSLFGELLSSTRKVEENRLLTHRRNEASLENYAERHKNDESVTLPHLPNFCPHCSMWVTALHDPANCNAKIPKERAAEGAKEKAKRSKERKLFAAQVDKTMALYFSAIRERDIISSRGTVTQPQVDRIDTSTVKKLSKLRNAETGRKIGMNKARELWSAVTKESTCQQELF
jgi:hypothetical protein